MYQAHRLPDRLPADRVGRGRRGRRADRLRQGVARAAALPARARRSSRGSCASSRTRRTTGGARPAGLPALALRATAAQPPGDAAPSPEGAALGREQREALLAAVSRLDERDRDVLTCRYFLELSEEETAERPRRPPRHGEVADRARARRGCGRRWSSERARARARRARARARRSGGAGPRRRPCSPRSSRGAPRAAPRAAPLGARRRGRRRSPLLGATLAIPDARSALLPRPLDRRRADRARRRAARGRGRPDDLELTLGERVTLDEAQASAATSRCASSTGEPDRVYVGERGTVWFLYGTPEDVRLLVAQTPLLDASTSPALLKKLVGRGHAGRAGDRERRGRASS